MKKALIIAVLVAAAVLALRGCFGGSTTSWNHRLTLVVETPSGDVTGSSVIEARVAYYSGGQMMSGTEVHYNLTGESLRA